MTIRAASDAIGSRRFANPHSSPSSAANADRDARNRTGGFGAGKRSDHKRPYLVIAQAFAYDRNQT